MNPNIVGFKVGGEKIVSTHYADDATMVIKQNRCFKEVIKDIREYEDASGAKVNYNKTKGLWTGSWKTRRVAPKDFPKIKWTNKNVKNLGIFFGNDDPQSPTCNEIIPKIQKRLAYWKQFKLSKFGKARVVEMFLISKLNYALKCYPMSKNRQENLQKSIFEYINFPQHVTISQKEMWKTLYLGGLKLTNIEIKSQTSKVKWLIEIATNPHFKVHLDIFATLMGTQKGAISGKYLIFLEKTYYE